MKAVDKLKKPLISASEIGVIVKEFLGKSFKTYEPIKNVITRKFFLSYEEKQAYDLAKSTALDFVFNKGKHFESEVVAQLSESYKKKYNEVEIIDFNNFFPENEEGKRQKLLVCNELSICCVPDILAIKNQTSYDIIEIKSSDYNTEMIESYKYQVAMQGILLALEYGLKPKDFTYRLILQETKDIEIEGTLQTKTEAKTFKVEGGARIWGSFEDVESYQKEIMLALKRLWESFTSGGLEKYHLSFEEMMRPFAETEETKSKKEVIKIEDAELVKLAGDYLEEKEREKSLKYISDSIKKKVSTIATDSIIIILQDDEGTSFKVSRSISKPVFWTPELKEKELEKVRAIELGTLKSDTTERLSVRI